MDFTQIAIDTSKALFHFKGIKEVILNVSLEEMIEVQEYILKMSDKNVTVVVSKSFQTNPQFDTVLQVYGIMFYFRVNES